MKTRPLKANMSEGDKLIWAAVFAQYYAQRGNDALVAALHADEALAALEDIESQGHNTLTSMRIRRMLSDG